MYFVNYVKIIETDNHNFNVKIKLITKLSCSIHVSYIHVTISDLMYKRCVTSPSDSLNFTLSKVRSKYNSLEQGTMINIMILLVSYLKKNEPCRTSFSPAPDLRMQ